MCVEKAKGGTSNTRVARLVIWRCSCKQLRVKKTLPVCVSATWQYSNESTGILVKEIAVLKTDF